ncbi:SpoIIE family protein phosphatase [Streptomyces sodiiphilus]|uniref:SpoIIE family protein phosphatase n=1 Tax=Streptomyces sodiiphilus TaxID=226217 RepID=A0ABP5ABZ0_9ACTN
MNPEEPGKLVGGHDPQGISAAPSSLFDLIRVAAFVLDADGRVVLWSPEAERLLGYPAEEALGELAGGLLVDREHMPMVLEWFGQVRAGASWAGVFPVRRRDGTLRPVEFRNIRLRDVRDRVHILGLATDADTVNRLETDLALSSSQVNQSPVGLAMFDTALRFLRVNPALERICGLGADAMVGHRVGEILPEVEVDSVERALRHVLRTGEPLVDWRTVGRTPADPVAEHVWSISYYRVHDAAGRTLGVATSAIDVTERERVTAEVIQARERLAVIADAGARIGTTLDLDRTAREVTEVAVPRLADLAAVDVLDSVLTGEITTALRTDGTARFRALAVEVRDDAEGAAAAADRVGELASYPPNRLLTQCVREARPILVPEVDSRMLGRIARDEWAAAELRRQGIHSYIAAPLVARGDVLGTVSLVRTRNPRPFDDQDLTLAAELAARAATCVDNARLYTRERTAALTLQRSMLPRPPGGSHGMEIASRYLPAVSEVGGDWFDVLPLENRRVGLVVGDVMGKGVRAAAIMGQLRTATRAFTRLGVPPARLLGYLDEIVLSLGDSIATCVYAVCDPPRARCEFAGAGHLPPVMIRPDGIARFVDLPVAPPLGVGGVAFLSRSMPLAPGTTLALYTDGLVEDRREPIDTGLEELLRLLEGPQRPLEEMCDAVLRSLPPLPSDDAALLLARAAGEQ